MVSGVGGLSAGTGSRGSPKGALISTTAPMGLIGGFTTLAVCCGRGIRHTKTTTTTTMTINRKSALRDFKEVLLLHAGAFGGCGGLKIPGSNDRAL
jgi:hypothetical protein